MRQYENLPPSQDLLMITYQQPECIGEVAIANADGLKLNDIDIKYTLELQQ
jgi:hypothetical protein